MRKKVLLLSALFLISLNLTGCSDSKGSGESTKSQEEAGGSSGQIIETEETEVPENSTEDFLTPEKTEEEIIQEKVTEYLDKMTIEEKAAQLFVILPESLMEGVGSVTAAGTATQEAIDQIPVGGFIYMEPNLKSPEQVKNMLENVQKYSISRIGLPMFLCVDEEGGGVARIAKSGNFDVPAFDAMPVIGQRENPKEAYDIGAAIGSYLFELGFNVDFAPVADVYTNSENQIAKKRAFSSDANIVSVMANAVAEGLKSQGIFACLKHFPGHGNTESDTHDGYAYTYKTKEELFECELIPFSEGIRNHVPFIMVGHISLPNITGDNTPASLSSLIMNDLLRKEMEYDGIIITDALNMGAIVNQYSSSETAVKCLQAGADLLLMPQDFKSAYNEVVSAIYDGRLPIERIDDSLTRILKNKIALTIHGTDDGIMFSRNAQHGAFMTREK